MGGGGGCKKAHGAGGAGEDVCVGGGNARRLKERGGAGEEVCVCGGGGG